MKALLISAFDSVAAAMAVRERVAMAATRAGGNGGHASWWLSLSRSHPMY